MVTKNLVFNFPIISIVFILIFFKICSSAPVDTYASFINKLNTNKCTPPEQIKVQSNTSVPVSNDNLLSYFKICQNLEKSKRSKEAKYLCFEIFDNLEKILCPPISDNLSRFTPSKNVCKDIQSIKDAVPDDKVIMKRLTDSITCDLMCDETFDDVCQVLFWSQLQQLTIVNKEENPTQEIKENFLQAKLEAGDSTPEDQAKLVQVVPTNAKAEKPPSTDNPKKSSDLPKTIQKSSSDAINLPKHITEQQNSIEANPPETQKDPSFNNLPLNQNSLVKNNYSLNAVQLQRDELNGNELPNQEEESPDSGVPELEDPHDQKEPMNEVDTGEKPTQDLHTSHITNELPNEESPEQPIETENLQPQKPVGNKDIAEAHDNQETEPHDKEETEPHVSKEDVAEPQPDEDKDKVDGIKSKIPSDSDKIAKPSEGGPKNTLPIADVTKEKATDGTDKNVPANTDKKVDSNTSTVEKAQSTLGQKSTEVSSSSSKDSNAASGNTEEESKTTVKLEDMEGEEELHKKPEDREPDTYTDLENNAGEADDEYARQEYDRGFEPSRSKGMPPNPANEVEVPKVDGMKPAFDDFSSRNNYNRPLAEGLPIFPEQEDGHFFFYFVSLVLILVGGYFLIHNKQKIIALIVEGRHERRRRSHGAGYKKLETK